MGTKYDHMNEDELLVNLSSTLSSALESEARGDGDAAVAKTAAIKNIQKSLTARILKRLDDGQPLVEVARKMKAMRACSHKSTIWREDSVSCNPLSQSSRTPSRPSKRSSMSEEWARNEHSLVNDFTCSLLERLRLDETLARAASFTLCSDQV